MQKRDKDIVSKVIGFFTVIFYWIILYIILYLFNFSEITMLISSLFYIVIPIVIFIMARKRAKLDSDNSSFYKGITIGLISSLVLLIVIPLVLLGSCFVLLGVNTI